MVPGARTARGAEANEQDRASACIVRTDGLAEEHSLAENVQLAPLYSLDLFRTFQAVREKARTPKPTFAGQRLRPAVCEYDHLQILLAQRMTGKRAAPAAK